jgi:hypothetical protein
MQPYEIAKPRAYGEIPAGLAGLFFVIFYVKETFSSPLLAQIVLLPLGILGTAALLLGIRSIIIRLYFNDTMLGISTGPFRRSIDLTRLAEVGYRRSHYTNFYLLRCSDGSHLSVQGTRFLRDDEWKSLILRSAHASGAKIDSKAEKSLAAADGAGAGYLA